MKVIIDKSDCKIEKPVTEMEAATYKNLHGDACTIILEEGDEGYVAPVVEEPLPAGDTADASPAPSDLAADPAGANLESVDTAALGEAVVLDGVTLE